VSEKIWKCKIGGECGELRHGADLPMRDAIALAFKEITGREPQFIFSGWGAELTEGERAVHENREASPEYYAKLKLEAAAPELLEALRELLAAELAMFPAFEAGKEAQDAWADRRAAARNNASFVIAKATGAQS
jgi:hypothetical protein